jgi:uracil-DNA glycosylase
MSAWRQLNDNIIACQRCPRLRSHCEHVGQTRRRAYQDWDYWTRPVPNFGDPAAKLLIVGLAPAAHGANRTGRMFTGDRSGDWLYRALHKAGLASQPRAETRDDGLELIDCAITSVCHCAPPDNKPSREEMAHCRSWLSLTIDLLEPVVLVALGQIAWKGAVDEAHTRGWLVGRRPKFGHAVVEALAEDRWLIGSYHPSQQNTFTGRLTEEMLDEVFALAVQKRDRGREICRR